MSVFVIPSNVYETGRTLFAGDAPGRSPRDTPVDASHARAAATTQAMQAVPAAGAPAAHGETTDTSATAQHRPASPDIGPAQLLGLGLLLMPPAGRTAVPAEPMPRAAIDRTDRRWISLKVGEAVARTLGMPPQDHTPDTLSALGGHALMASVASGAGLDVALLVVAAQAAGFIDDASLRDADTEALADRLDAFIRAEFRDEIAFYQAMGKLADLDMPTRPELARELMRAAGLNPDEPAIRRERTESRMSTVVLSNAATGARIVTPASRYVGSDSLDEETLAGMWTGDNTAPTQAQIQDILARLPASLTAEFERRFDAYAGETAAQTAILVRARLALHARKNGIDLSAATVSVTRPTLEHFRTEVLPLRGGAVIYDGQAQAIVPAQGYVYTVGTAERQQRFFLSSKTGLSFALPADTPIGAWVDAHRAIVFGSEASAAPSQPLVRTRVVAEQIAAGRMSTLESDLAATFRKDIEKSRDAARGQTPRERLTDLLLGLIPFRSMIQAIRRDDVAAAIIAGGMDVLSLVPLVCAGVRLTNLGIKVGRNGFTIANAALGSPQLAAAVKVMTTRAAGKATLHGLSNLAAGLRDALRRKIAQGAPKGWARIMSLDPEQLAARMRASYPGFASDLHAAASKLRGATVADGQWRVDKLANALAANAGNDAIGKVPAVFAQDKLGRQLRLQQLGRARAYAQVNAATGECVGAVLLSGADDVLYRSLPVDTMRRYRIAAPELLAGIESQRAAANGSIALHGRTYARIGDDLVEIVPDTAGSTAQRPIWHPVPPDGTAPDAIVHRIAYDADKRVWRQAETPQLSGGGRVKSAHGDSSATSSSGVSSEEAAPVASAPFGASAGIAPDKLHLALQPFGHGIRSRYPSLIGHARKNYFVQGVDGQVRRFPGGYSGGTVTPELLDSEFVHSLDRIMDYSHANALGETLAGYRYDAASASVTYQTGNRAVSSHDAARAIYTVREGPVPQYMIPSTDHLGDAEACAQMLLAEGKSSAQVMEQLNQYQQLRLQFPRTADPYRGTIMPLAIQLKGAPVTTFTNGATHQETLQLLQRSLEADAPVILFRKDKAVVLDAIETDAQGTWLTIRHPHTASQVRIRDHKEFWLGDDRSRTVTPTPPDFELNDIRIVTIEHEHRLRHLRGVRNEVPG